MLEHLNTTCCYKLFSSYTHWLWIQRYWCDFCSFYNFQCSSLLKMLKVFYF